MMKKLTFLTLILIVAAAFALFWDRTHRSPWSSGKPKAEEQFALANDAIMKLYNNEAVEHLHRALELDPSYVAAKIFLFFHTPNQKERDRLAKELRSLDLDSLSPRERFLVRYHLAVYDHKPDVARKVLADYRKRFPDDPYAIELAGGLAWADQDLERATKLYSRLLEVNPNWVTAQNRLGYTAMAQGDFKRAEQQFNTYEFVAPDQANPHDSKAELFTLVGRYKEAKSELERALAIRPDFCASYGHLIDVALLEGDFSEADAVIERASEHCTEEQVSYEKCRISIWRAAETMNPAEAWDAVPESCHSKRQAEQLILIHRLALASGHDDIARQYEDDLASRLQKYQRQKLDITMGSPVLAHLEGERALQEGHYEAAIKHFTQADRELLYWGNGPAVFKLYNRVRLAVAQQRSGDTVAARKTLDQVLKVNPKFPHPELRAN
jgi:tetratricopeptide (TPR) repeat protein